MNFQAWRSTVTLAAGALPIAILYVTEGCNLKCAMCSYRSARADELTLEELAALAAELRALGLRRIVFSGGEPLVRRDVPEILRLFRGVRRTLLTNGLLLERRLPELHAELEEYIVSLDGATAATHDRIRGTRSYDRVLEGIRAAAAAAPRRRVTIRTVVQKENFRELGALVDLAHRLGADGISFLPVDVASAAFGRTAAAEGGGLLLAPAEAAEFARLCGAIVAERRNDFRTGFIETGPERFRAMAGYFAHWTDHTPLPRNRCNAPDVSAVITATGSVLPCFFLPPIGSVRETRLREILASPRARDVRSQVRSYQPEQCHRCTCTLSISPARALFDRF